MFRQAYLISIYENDLVEIQWEQYIQEQDLVGPDDALFFRLRAKPMGPVIGDELIVKVVLLCHMRDKILNQRA